MRLPRVPHRLLLPALLISGLGLLGAVVLFAGRTGPPGGRLVEVVVGDVRRASPIATLTTEAEGDVVALVFAGLMRPGPDGTPEADLAESWEATPDGLTYTFRLRPGLTWHDGVPLTASDVAFTIALIQAGDFTGPAALAAAWGGVEVFVADPRTVLFHLVEPSAEFLSRASIGLLPAHLRDAMPDRGLGVPAFEQRPVGAGPYRVRAIEEGRVRLERFERYAHGAPHIGQVELRTVEDAAEQARVLARGDGDAGLLSEVAIDEERALSERPDLRAIVLTRSAYTIVYLNVHITPLDDLSTRRALIAALDRPSLTTIVGRGLPGAVPLVPKTWAGGATGTNAADDPGALLDAAEWRLQGDGVRRRNGQALTLEVATNDSPTRRALAEAVASQWSRLGAEVKVTVLPANVLVGERLRRGAYQAAVYGWDAGIDPDPYSGWHTTQAGGAGANVAGFRDREADTLLEAARTTLDANERREFYGLFAARFTGQAASAVLYYPQRLYLLPVHLTGFTPGVLFAPGSRFRDIHLWRLG